ncbi:hypothetical protein H696_03031 [Fonticula alba]|uniref:Citrate transporter-like domain-containing protein n=1 Tax=Fonticula alba TaxID=691883 RepID=A0A058Z992_FONAL|nr:hypothetical protein H696_03031 [Fonticula alba]KCV70676.1 hypothetical protein H696_03031 [Fonticula alba]|eukprot:XP_009495192.1 hypothetical protein H696_03031 [Fonticula alba]
MGQYNMVADESQLSGHPPPADDFQTSGFTFADPNDPIMHNPSIQTGFTDDGSVLPVNPGDDPIFSTRVFELANAEDEEKASELDPRVLLAGLISNWPYFLVLGIILFGLALLGIFAWEPMGWQAWFSLCTIAVVLVALFRELYPPHITMMFSTALLIVTQILTPEQAFSGFSSDGVLAIGFIFVVARALEINGSVDSAMKYILGHPKHLWVALARVCFPIAFFSAFMSNTALMAMSLPIMMEWSRKIGQPVSKLLMPVNLSIILGGMCTIIGTSTNIIVADLVREKEPDTDLGFFTIGYIAIPNAILCLLFVIFTSSWLLPDAQSSSGPFKKRNRAFVTAMRIPPGSPCHGKTVTEIGLDGLNGVTLISIERPVEGDGTQLAIEEDSLFGGAEARSRSSSGSKFSVLAAGSPGLMLASTSRPGSRAPSRSASFVNSPYTAPGTGSSSGARHPMTGASAYPVEGLTTEELTAAYYAAADAPPTADTRARHRVLYMAADASARAQTICEKLRLPATPGGLTLQEGDILLYAGLENDIVHLLRSDYGMEPAAVPHLQRVSGRLRKRVLAEVVIAHDSPLAGRSLRQARFRSNYNAAVLAIHRRGGLGTLSALSWSSAGLLGPDGGRLPTDVLASGGMGPSAERAAFSESDRLLAPENDTGVYGASATVAPFLDPETGLSSQSSVSLLDTPLRPGDALIIETTTHFLDYHRHDHDFALVNVVQSVPSVFKRPAQWKRVATLLVTLLMIAVNVAGVLSLSTACLCAASILLALGCIKPAEAARSVGGELLVLIACSFPLGKALEVTGAANVISESLLGVLMPLGSIGIISGVFLITVIFTQVISNPATATLVFPIAYEMAKESGVSTEIVAFTLMVATSTTFIVPISYQTNVMITTPGGYTFGDFARLGVPLTFFSMVLCIPLIWLIY